MSRYDEYALICEFLSLILASKTKCAIMFCFVFFHFSPLALSASQTFAIKIFSVTLPVIVRFDTPQFQVCFYLIAKSRAAKENFQIQTLGQSEGTLERMEVGRGPRRLDPRPLFELIVKCNNG